MGRWTQYDEDEYRLPEGMKRVGYDSDTGRFYFRDQDGVLYKGPEGAEYGEMTRVSEGATPVIISSDTEDIEASRTREDGYQPLATDGNGDIHHRYTNTDSAYRSLFPFFLIIAVVLLLVWRLILSPGLSPPKPTCPSNATPYLVQPGDSCWEISNSHGCPFEEFKKLNAMIDCEHLLPGTTVCLPSKLKSRQR